MTDLRSINFYATPEHSCSYLAELEAKTLFVDPQAIITKDTYSQLSDLGFRRSGRHIYRPHCSHCNACISARIPAELFKPSKSQRRIINKNKDITVTATTPQLNEENYRLYHDYICSRHQNGDMYPPSEEQFLSFLVESSQDTVFFEFRDRNNVLCAVSVCDIINKGISAIYTFFDPTLNHRSLGSYAIMWQLQECLRQNVPYLYLGYWVKDCRKMNYKLNFRPVELLLDSSWVLVIPS